MSILYFKNVNVMIRTLREYRALVRLKKRSSTNESPQPFVNLKNAAISSTHEKYLTQKNELKFF